jgi:hypothetical protein
MAEDEIQICNIALRRVQGEPITDLETDESKSAVLCRTFYEPTRDAILADPDHPWSFATRRQLLAAAVGTNLTSYLYAYQLPADPYCLRPIVLIDSYTLNFEQPGYPFKVENRILYTDMLGAGLKYIARVTDVLSFDPLFTDALCWRLAAELLKPIEGSATLDLWGMYQATLLMAGGANAQGAQEPGQAEANWVQSRHT